MTDEDVALILVGEDDHVGRRSDRGPGNPPLAPVL